MKLKLIDDLLGVFVRMHEKNGFAAVKLLGCLILGIAIVLAFVFSAVGLPGEIGNPVIVAWFLIGGFLLLRFSQLIKNRE